MLRSSASLFRGYSVLTAGHLLTSASGFLVVLLIVDRFGAQGLGQVTLAVSVVSYALIIAGCGTQLHAVRTAATSEEAIPATAGTVLSLRLAVGVPTYLALLAVASLVPRLLEIRGLIALFGLGILVHSLDVSWIPQALNRTGLLAAANLGSQVFYLLGVWWLATLERGLGIAAWSKVGGALVVALWLLAWMRLRIGPMRLPRPPGDLWRMAAQAAPIAGTNLVRSLGLGSDLLIVGVMLGDEELGHYAGAVRLFLFLLSLASAYFVVLLPRLAQRGREERGALGQELRASLGRVVGPTGVVAGILIWLASPVLSGLFGPGFEQATSALRLLLLALLANLVGRHFRQVLLVRNRQVLDLRATMVATGVHLVAKVGLVATLGLTGAALGTLIGELTLMLLLYRAAVPLLGGKPVRSESMEG